MMPDLYVLARNCQHEPEEIPGVYSSKDLAIKAWQEMIAENPGSCGWPDIVKLPLDGKVWAD